MAEGVQDWRELCAAAAKEEDSAKLTGLVNQIIKALDEESDGGSQRISGGGQSMFRSRDAA